jgi:hypothetical protein
MSMTEQQYHLDHWTGDKSWTDMVFQIVEPGKLIRAQAELGSYSIELQPDGKTMRLTFDAGSGVRTCPKKFQVINTAQVEAFDHHRRLLAQRQMPARMKPPKW